MITPIDLLFTSGLFAFYLGTLSTALNKNARVPRISSGTAVIVNACFIVANLHLHLYYTIATNVLTVFTWAFIWKYRTVE